MAHPLRHLQAQLVRHKAKSKVLATMALALLLSTKTAEQVYQQAVSARLLLLAKALATESNHQQHHANQAMVSDVILCVLFCRPAPLMKLPWVLASGCEIDQTQGQHERSLARSAAASVHQAAVAVTAATCRQKKTCCVSWSATAPAMEATAPKAAAVVAAAAAQQLS